MPPSTDTRGPRRTTAAAGSGPGANARGRRRTKRFRPNVRCRIGEWLVRGEEPGGVLLRGRGRGPPGVALRLGCPTVSAKGASPGACAGGPFTGSLIEGVRNGGCSEGSCSCVRVKTAQSQDPPPRPGWGGGSCSSVRVEASEERDPPPRAGWRGGSCSSVRVEASEERDPPSGRLARGRRRRLGPSCATPPTEAPYGYD
jgi:hypothetical protein